MNNILIGYLLFSGSIIFVLYCDLCNLVRKNFKNKKR